jgi:NO-binding membrane sensor protein with MHYT domain
LAEVHHFAHGWVTPALAYIMAVLGCLVGVLLCTKARTRTGRRRIRLLLYATMAIGGTGIWQVHFIAMLGFDVPESVVRYDTTLLTASFGSAILFVGAGLFTLGLGNPRPGRLGMAGALIGLGIAAMHYTGMAAVRTGGRIDYEPVRFAASITVAIVAATAALCFIVTLRGLRATVLAALALGTAICGMHYTAMAAVRVHFSVEHDIIAGIDPMTLVAPIVLLGGAGITMLAFFTFGTSTVRDLRMIYEEPGERSEAIEPWMIEEVLSRTSKPIVLTPLVGGSWAHRRNGRRRSVDGIDISLRSRPVWGGTPVWGQSERDNGWVPSARRGDATGHAFGRSTPSGTPSGGLGGTPSGGLGGTPSGGLNGVPPAPNPARYPPNDPGWLCPGVVTAPSPGRRNQTRL